MATVSPFFAVMRAVEITIAKMREFAKVCLAARATPATVNRHFGVLSRCSRWLHRAVASAAARTSPDSPRGSHARGSWSTASTWAIRKHLPPEYHGVLDFGDLTARAAARS